jgi:hypothetical protein
MFLVSILRLGESARILTYHLLIFYLPRLINLLLLFLNVNHLRALPFLLIIISVSSLLLDVILKRPLILISWIIKWAHIVKTSTHVWSRIIIESNLPSIIVASTLFILLVMPILAAIPVPILIPMCKASSMIMMTVLRKIVVDNSSISHSKSRIFNFLLLRWVQLHHLRRGNLLWEIFRLIRHD